MTTKHQRSSRRLAFLLAVPFITFAAAPALADDHDRWRDHQRWEHREHYEHARPGYYYAPPPPPVYYAPPAPPPGISLVFPFR